MNWIRNNANLHPMNMQKLVAQHEELIKEFATWWFSNGNSEKYLHMATSATSVPHTDAINRTFASNSNNNNNNYSNSNANEQAVLVYSAFFLFAFFLFASQKKYGPCFLFYCLYTNNIANKRKDCKRSKNACKLG